jgi:hypothetical protein
MVHRHRPPLHVEVRPPEPMPERGTSFTNVVSDSGRREKAGRLLLEDTGAPMKPGGGRLGRDQPATHAQRLTRIDYFLEYNAMQLFA